MSSVNRLLASVWMITYNQEKYVAQAIESVLSQKTTFDFELVIGEDCSTDRTRAICLEYERKHPDRIRVLPRITNLGIHKNIIATLQACSGSYIALLEGDDYWTDPTKLQTQVDFLLNNAEFVMCYQKTLEINELTGALKITNEGDQPIVGLEDILSRGWFMRTGSLVFKGGLLKEFPTWFYEFPSTDYILHILIARYGKVRFLDQTTSVYRRHPNGISQRFQEKTLEFIKEKLRLLDCINGYFSYKYNGAIKIHKVHLYNTAFIHLLRRINSMSDVFYLTFLLFKIDHSSVFKRVIRFMTGTSINASEKKTVSD